RRECVRLLILKIQDPKNSPSQLDWYAQFGCGPCCDTNELLSFFAAIIDVFQDHRLLLLTGTPQQSGIESLCVVVRKPDPVRSAPGLRQNAETPAQSIDLENRNMFKPVKVGNLIYNRLGESFMVYYRRNVPHQRGNEILFGSLACIEYRV